MDTVGVSQRYPAAYDRYASVDGRYPTVDRWYLSRGIFKKDIFMAGANKRVISGSFRIDLNSRTKSRRRRAYHQNEVLHITKAKALYIIIAKEDAACG